MTKSQSSTFEKNIYLEHRCGAFRFIVAVHPLPKDSATFSSIEEGATWARRRRVELLEQKASPKPSGNASFDAFENAVRPTDSFNRSLQPENIVLADIFQSYEDAQLDKLAGEPQEASRIRQLREWFGKLTLGQLDYRVLERWQAQRQAGKLGSGRNPNRGETHVGSDQTPKKPLTKHQRYWRKKSGVKVPEKQIYPVSTQTVRHDIAVLRRAINAYFNRNGYQHSHSAWLQAHYVMWMPLPDKADPRDRRLSDQEVIAITGELDTLMLKSAILFALLTTLRRAEIVSLRWENVDFNRRIIRLTKPGHQTFKKKKTHTRDVPLLPGAIKILRDLGPQKNGPIFAITTNGLTQAWRRAADAVNIYDARLHDCRRESISRLIETCKLSLETVVVFSGHSDLAVLQRYYARPNPSLIAAQLAEIPDAVTLMPSL